MSLDHSNSSAVDSSKFADKANNKVTYALDIQDQPDDDSFIKAKSAKGSLAGSVYYSASESGTNSILASALHSFDDDNSDAEFQLEIAEDVTEDAPQGLHLCAKTESASHSM